MKSNAKTCQRYGISLVEVLISSLLIGTCMSAIFYMSMSGRKSAEYEARYLQALSIAEYVCEEVRRSAVAELSELPSQETALPLKGPQGEPQSPYSNKLFYDTQPLLSTFPELSENLENFQVLVELHDLDTTEEAREAEVIVYFRLSKGHDKWHSLRMSLIIARHSPL